MLADETSDHSICSTWYTRQMHTCSALMHTHSSLLIPVPQQTAATSLSLKLQIQAACVEHHFVFIVYYIETKSEATKYSYVSE